MQPIQIQPIEIKAIEKPKVVSGQIVYPQKMGGWSNTMKKVTEASAATKKILVGQKQNVLDYFKKEGANLKIDMFEPESFKTQVVAGMNYTVIYRILLCVQILLDLFL